MITQNYLSNQNERIIYDLIKSGRFTITDRIDCYFIKRCDACPLQDKGCINLRNLYAHKHYPELLI